MYLERKQDLSLYYFVEDMFDDLDNINIVDSFPDGELTLPTIAIDTDSIDTRQFELGNYERVQTRRWYIDIFATNKSQRDEFGYRLLNELQTKLPVYNYDEGFPPDDNPTKIGVLKAQDLFLEIIRVNPEFTDKMYHRAVILYTAIYESI